MRSVGTAKAGFGCIFVLLLITGYAHAGQANVANEGIFGTLRDWASKLSREIYRLRYGIGPRQKESGTEAAKGDLWAVLVAGSAGFGNYRHQADVAHAYHVLHNGGVPDEHIIVMVYDDIAHSPSNPHPGTIINHPNGQDLYGGMPKDYTRHEVTAENFLAVIRGDSDAMMKIKSPFASGRVVEAKSTDRIFVFYSDHGAPGILGMPSGEFLYADKLHHAIRHRYTTHGFKEMVLYIEACESGSMFEGLLEDDINVYATTAANSQESSWGVYCPGMDPSPPPEYMTCLGDLYSVAWMEDSESNDITTESLLRQFEKVRKRTSQNFTFIQGSHVMRYGELEIDEEPVSWYLGDPETGKDGKAVSGQQQADWKRHQAIHQRDADLVPLIMAVERSNDLASKSIAEEALKREKYKRKKVDKDVASAVAKIMDSIGHMSSQNSEVQMLMTQPIPPVSGTSTKALVSDWDCLRGMMNAWQKACGPLDQYSMKHSRAFANLCNLGIKEKSLYNAALSVCTP